MPRPESYRSQEPTPCCMSCRHSSGCSGRTICRVDYDRSLLSIVMHASDAEIDEMAVDQFGICDRYQARKRST